MTDEPSKPLSPTRRTATAGSFVLGTLQGRSAIGEEIWLGRDEQFDRPVTIRELRGNGADAREDLEREMRITAWLQHPGIPPVYSRGETPDGCLLFCSAHVEGRWFHQDIRAFHGADRGDSEERAVSFRRLVGVCVEVCDVLSYIHSKGILYCDLKPQRIFLGEWGGTFILDWRGVRTFGEAESRFGNPTMHASCSPAYMSPEHGQYPEALTTSTDIYCLGSVLYEVISGHVPNDAGTIAECLRGLQAGTLPVPLEKVAPCAPHGLTAICRKAMSRDPAQRYSAGKPFADDLQRWLAGVRTLAEREMSFARPH